MRSAGLALTAAALVLLAAPGETLACACCTNPGQRYVDVFLFNHANPKSDGMEMVGVSAAFIFIFLPLSLPAFLLAKESCRDCRRAHWSGRVRLYRHLV